MLWLQCGAFKNSAVHSKEAAASWHNCCMLLSCQCSRPAAALHTPLGDGTLTGSKSLGPMLAGVADGFDSSLVLGASSCTACAPGLLSMTLKTVYVPFRLQHIPPARGSACWCWLPVAGSTAEQQQGPPAPAFQPTSWWFSSLASASSSTENSARDVMVPGSGLQWTQQPGKMLRDGKARESSVCTKPGDSAAGFTPP